MTTLSTPPQAYTRETLAQAYVWLKDQPNSIKERAKNADALVSLYLHACRHGLDVFKENSSESEAPRSSQNFKNTLKDLSEGFRQFEESTVVEMPNNVSHLNPNVPKQNLTQQNARTGSTTPSSNRFSTSAFSESHDSSGPSMSAGSRQQQNIPHQHPSDHTSDYRSENDPHVRNHRHRDEGGNSHSVRVNTEAPVPSRHGSETSGGTNANSSRDPFPVYRAYLSEDEWARSGTSVSLEPPFPPFANAASELMLDSRSHEILRRVRRKMNLSSENEALRMLLSLGFERLRDIVP